MKNKILFFLLLILTNLVQAQETLSPLKGNAVLKKYWAKPHVVNQSSNQRKLVVKDTLDLPIVDDFSGPGIFPNPNIWLDSLVYINQNYPLQAPTIGVATFDGVNKFGNPYDNVSSLPHGNADSLTSRYINLYSYVDKVDSTVKLYQPKDSICLSFFYEPTGLGDAPEQEDSLVLQFRVAPNKTWTTVKTLVSTNISDSTFSQALVMITDTAFLKKGFQFRFQNYATLSGNLDHWHIDYVRLNSKRSINDVYISDIAFSDRTLSYLNNYQQMPWSHFAASQKKTTYTISVRNNNKPGTSAALAFHQLGIYQRNGTQIDTSAKNALPLLEPNTTYNLAGTQFPFNFTLYGSADSLSFEIRNTITSTPDTLRKNDTIRFYQNFYNYFAYDDGSAENAYGINVAKAMLAYKFKLSKPDTLRAIGMFFTQEQNNVSQNLFKIRVWNNLSPEHLIHEEDEFVSPVYENKVNGFHIYKLSQPVLIKDSVYIGWIQASDAILNLGFDLNTDAHTNAYYNFDGNWRQSTIKGTLMMRPYVGKPLPVGIESIKGSRADILMYPNPASDLLNIKGLPNNSAYSFSIINILGQEVLNIQNLSQTIDISSIPAGLYFVRLKNQNSGMQMCQKLIIRR